MLFCVVCSHCHHRGIVSGSTLRLQVPLKCSGCGRTALPSYPQALTPSGAAPPPPPETNK
jgi:hypothetical protein